MVKRPPHILITTPESLYLYLTAERSRQTLKTVRTVVVDEIHALARDKRGSHFALSMERLRALLPHEPQCIGLSATTRPLERLSAFLTGAPRDDRPPCELVQIGHLRPWSLSVEIPEDELTAVATQEMWGQLYDRLVELSKAHRTMLVFTNTRRLAERLAHDLGERLGHSLVAAHHGSMAKELRVAAEERLKAGTLKVMVATASLELGIDIGSIDLVVQLGSPRCIAVMLQRLGPLRPPQSGRLEGRAVRHVSRRARRVRRSGARHSRGKPRCGAHARQAPRRAGPAARRRGGRPGLARGRPLRSSCAGPSPTQASPGRSSTTVLHMVSEGVATTTRAHPGAPAPRPGERSAQGPAGRAADGAVRTAAPFPTPSPTPSSSSPRTSRSAPSTRTSPSSPCRATSSCSAAPPGASAASADGAVRVENAHGQAPTVPFWRGEAPARTDELSHEVARLREDDRPAT